MIGSDLDGGFGTEQCPSDLDTIADLQKLDSILENRGYEKTISKRFYHKTELIFYLVIFLTEISHLIKSN